MHEHLAYLCGLSCTLLKRKYTCIAQKATYNVDAWLETLYSG